MYNAVPTVCVCYMFSCTVHIKCTHVCEVILVYLCMYICSYVNICIVSRPCETSDLSLKNSRATYSPGNSNCLEIAIYLRSCIRTCVCTHACAYICNMRTTVSMIVLTAEK